jgi:hypothetical protein
MVAMARAIWVVTLGAWCACYTGAPATRDVNRAWTGRTRATIEGRWGAPAATGAADHLAVLQWSHTTTHVTLPGASGSLVVEPGHVAAAGAFQPGAVWHTTTEAAALVDPAGTIARVDGASLRWGPPNDANLHWGTVMGGHVGLGRLDSTPTPLPSGNVYLGGMLGPTLALVGTYALVAGTADAGGAIGMAAGIGAQWWPVNRLWLRGGPALLLAFEPGFEDAALHPGVTTGASYAVIKVGTFALDLCLDVTLGPSVAFGTLGVGVNLN